MADRPPPTWALVADYAGRLDEAKRVTEAERRFWMGLFALFKYAVPVERPIVIPLQRTAPGREVDLWPRAVIQDRAPSRFIDTRNT